MTPRVTVLVAVKDGLPWVRETVASVLAQTYEDFELLVVDDASTDGTAEAVEAFGDPRIRILRNEHNLGQVPSLNLGLEAARGEIVARIDADDRMLPERLARQVAALDAEPAVALVGTWMDVVDERGRSWATVRGRVRSYPEFVAAIVLDSYPWGHPSLVFRRDVVRRLGGYDASLAPSEDKDLYRRLALYRQEARAIEEPLVLYRRHDRQLSQERWEVQLRHDHVGQERFLTELGVRDPEPLRRLLAGDPSAWPADASAGAALEQLLAGAGRRLRLDPAETAELERLLALGALRRVAGGWRAGARAHWRVSPAVARFAAGRGGAAALPSYAASLALAPLASPLTAVRSALGSRALEPVRGMARRSRLLRAVYARLPR